jgi:hypothetical protein
MCCGTAVGEGRCWGFISRSQSRSSDVSLGAMARGDWSRTPAGAQGDGVAGLESDRDEAHRDCREEQRHKPGPRSSGSPPRPRGAAHEGGSHAGPPVSWGTPRSRLPPLGWPARSQASEPGPRGTCSLTCGGRGHSAGIADLVGGSGSGGYSASTHPICRKRPGSTLKLPRADFFGVRLCEGDFATAIRLHSSHTSEDLISGQLPGPTIPPELIERPLITITT